MKKTVSEPVSVPVLLGPTAAGKTALALDIAYRCGWEIISCDSRQIYRGMRIGTAQPGPEECARVKHWLVGIRDPDESYSAHGFANDAGAIIRERARNGITTLLCGGTGLYFECLRKGIGPRIASDPALRERLKMQVHQEGSAALYRELHECDPQTAHRIHPNDAQRIVRALAVYRQTGMPMSVLKRRTRPPADLAFMVAVIMPRLRELYKRIEKRTDEMVAAGFTLISSGALLVTMGTLAFDISIRKEATTGSAIVLANRFLVNMPLMIEIEKEVL